MPSTIRLKSIAGEFEQLRRELRAGLEQTQRRTRMLFEEVIDRIARLGESRNS